MNKFDKAIKNMSDMIWQNSKVNKSRQTFPVSCIILDEHDKVLISKINNKKNDKHIQNNHHAEFLCMNNLNIKNTSLTMFVTLPPCRHCFLKIRDKLKELNIKLKIYYLYDDIRSKLSNKFWVGWKNEGNIIKKIYMRNFSTKESKLRMLYCVDKVIDGFSSHKNEDRFIINTKRKNHKLKIAKYFKSMRPSKGQINEKWVYQFYLNNK